MKTLYILLNLLLLNQLVFAQWDPNAGLIMPYTNRASVEVSSGTNPNTITDGDPNSFWESTSPLPDNFISRSELNIFLSSSKFTMDKANQFATNAVDGILSSKSEIYSGIMEINFIVPETIKQLSIKFNTKETIKIEISTQNNKFEYYYSPEENYQLKNITFPKREKIYSIIIESIDSFEMFEIAGLYNSPKEEVIFDLKENKEIGWIGSRHFNGDGVLAIEVMASDDKIHWEKIAQLNPMATSFVDQIIVPVVLARYIKVSFVLKSLKYQKAKLHEFTLYDSYGPYGKPEPPKKATRTYSESFGINAIWGWGYSVSSDKLKGEKGPLLFNKVSKLARNYHTLGWDIKKPGQNPNYDDMALGKGTAATSWMNWYTEYNTWKNAGFKTDVCLMFNNNSFKDSLWMNPQAESLEFGNYFGSFFSTKNDLISLVEIGNEPWEYSKPVCREILLGMSNGLANSSKNITILPCAVQAYSRYSILENYISDYLTKENSKYLTGLNTHIYSYVHDYDGHMTAVNPEDPRSETWSMNNMIRFSKANLNSKPIFVTEYGYDSDGGGDDCTHSVCISESDQAVLGSRMTLILYRLGVEQFYWYYFANVDYTSFLYNRSGLLSSYSKGFSKKAAFNTFEILQKELGDYYFHDIIMENDNAYIYAYGDSSGRIRRIVAWRPTSKDHNEKKWIEFPFDYSIEEAVSIVVDEVENSSEVSYVRGVNNLKINLSGVPVIIKIR